MAGWVDSVMSPLKAAGDVAKGLVDIRDTVKFGESIIKLQSQILAAQQGALSGQSREAELTDEIRALKAKIAEVEGWEAEKKRYALTELPPGVFVYGLKPEMANGEPMHHLCQKCFQQGQKSILHAGNVHQGRRTLTCHPCNYAFTVGHYRPQARPARAESDGW